VPSFALPKASNALPISVAGSRGHTGLAEQLLVTLEASLHLMVGCGYAIERMVSGIGQYYLSPRALPAASA